MNLDVMSIYEKGITEYFTKYYEIEMQGKVSVIWGNLKGADFETSSYIEEDGRHYKMKFFNGCDSSEGVMITNIIAEEGNHVIPYEVVDANCPYAFQEKWEVTDEELQTQVLKGVRVYLNPETFNFIDFITTLVEYKITKNLY